MTIWTRRTTGPGLISGGMRIDMAKFRKKPIVIEAIQWSGLPGDITLFSELGTGDRPLSLGASDHADRYDLCVETLEGVMTANPNDWIIQGVQGEIYPCKPDIFEATYEAVDP